MPRRLTKQRQLVNDVAMKLFHPSADEVYELVKKENPSISRATVYRNLNILAEDGFLRKLFLSSGATRFDTNVKLHDHFYCEKCGVIIDLEDSSTIKIPIGFEVHSHSTTFYGICQKCKNINTKIIKEK